MQSKTKIRVFWCGKDENLCTFRAPRAQPTLDKGDEDLGTDSQKPARSVDQLALRNPSQLVVGVPQTLLTEWKHHPTKLVTASVQYIAQVRIDSKRALNIYLNTFQNVQKATEHKCPV